MRQSRPIPELAACLVLALPILAGCPSGKAGDKSDDDSGGDDDSSQEVKATPVKVAAVTSGSISQAITSSSTVDAERRADIHLEVAGTVESIAVEEGDRVAAGALLATLRNPALKGELERAETSFARASDEFDSARALFDRGFLSRNEYDTALHAFETARVTAEQARETHEARRITSPIGGTVSLRAIRYGEAVTPGQLAFQVVDLAALRVEVSLPEKDLSRLRSGLQARVSSQVLEVSPFVAGHVERISPVVDPATGTVKVTIALDPAQSLLRPGMFVGVEIVTDTHEQARLVPKRAIVYDEGEPLAFVVRESTATRTPIEIGFTDRDTVEVVAGLDLADRVVVVGQGLLRDGSEVRVVQ